MLQTSRMQKRRGKVQPESDSLQQLACDDPCSVDSEVMETWGMPSKAPAGFLYKGRSRIGVRLRDVGRLVSKGMLKTTLAR